MLSFLCIVRIQCACRIILAYVVIRCCDVMSKVTEAQDTFFYQLYMPRDKDKTKNITPTTPFYQQGILTLLSKSKINCYHDYGSCIIISNTHFFLRSKYTKHLRRICEGEQSRVVCTESLCRLYCELLYRDLTQTVTAGTADTE